MALKESRYPIPDDMRQALESSGLMGAFAGRSDSQQKGYIAWIVEGRREFMRRKRIGQMLSELEAGDAYIGSAWQGGRKGR